MSDGFTATLLACYRAGRASGVWQHEVGRGLSSVHAHQITHDQAQNRPSTPEGGFQPDWLTGVASHRIIAGQKEE
jgi:hypothetical protein